MSEDGVRPRPERHVRTLSGFVRRGGGGLEPATFDNVSEQGCCILMDLEIGESLVVMIPKVGTASAQVRWAIGGRAGLRFDRTVEVGDFDPGE